MSIFILFEGVRVLFEGAFPVSILNRKFEDFYLWVSISRY